VDGGVSTVLAQRLRLLQGQAGKAPAVPGPLPQMEAKQSRANGTRPEVPENIRRLLGLRARAAVRPVTPLRPPDRHLPGDEIAPGLRYFESRHEAPALAPVLDVSFAKNFETVAPAQLLCFDTETTGLAGGTGTRAFMIGAADRVDGQLRIRQLMTTTMAAERAMLEAFARWLQPDTVLVSYNGRSYDAPLLKTRYRLARMPCPIAPLAHLDLLHPVRRRYRGLWENCRLATVERQLLKVLREDDLPGSEAPRAWRDYLAGGPATDLRRVLAHNHTDVRSLMQLLAHMATTAAL
tara:strand:- start:3694 stop:4575 length:882 start_codon:yes stop_codon:yes gene_type:complete